MSTRSSTITHNLPDFPYSPVTAARRHLTTLLSSSHFVTTIVSPPATHPPLTISFSDRAQDNADPPPTLSDNAEPFPTEFPVHPPSRLRSSTRAPSRAESSKHPVETARSQSLKVETARLQSLKHTFSRTYSSKQSPVPLPTAQECVASSSHRKSAWRRFKRMGNRFITPLRSLGLCCTGGRHTMALCEDVSACDGSSGSSWCNSGEYPPDFIRELLENNALFGRVTVE